MVTHVGYTDPRQIGNARRLQDPLSVSVTDVGYRTRTEPRRKGGRRRPRLPLLPCTLLYMHSGTTSMARNRTPQMHADREVGPRGNPELTNTTTTTTTRSVVSSNMDPVGSNLTWGMLGAAAAAVRRYASEPGAHIPSLLTKAQAVDYLLCDMLNRPLRSPRDATLAGTSAFRLADKAIASPQTHPDEQIVACVHYNARGALESQTRRVTLHYTCTTVTAIPGKLVQSKLHVPCMVTRYVPCTQAAGT